MTLVPPRKWRAGEDISLKGRVQVILAAALVALMVVPVLATPAAAATPNVVRVTTAPTWAFVNTYIEVSWDVKLNSTTPPSAITDSALYVDGVSHAAQGQAYSLYASRASGATGDGKNFVATFLAPALPGALYFIVIANVSGTTIYNATERSIALYPEPVVRLTTPGLIAGGETGNVRLDVEWPGTLSVSMASVHYGPSSHADVRNYTAYPNSTVPQGGAARTYNFSITAPAAEGNMYLIGRARIGGVDFYTAAEYNIAVSTGPRALNIQLAPSTGVAVAGQSIAVSFDIAFNSGGQAVTAVLRFGSISHASEGLDPGLYPSTSTSTTAAPGTRFSLTFVAPSDPGTAYGIVTVLLGSKTYVASQEISVPVLARPVFTIESVPERVDGSSLITVVWRVSFAGNASLITDSSIYWDTASHATFVPSSAVYPNAIGHFAGNSSNLFTASIPSLGSEGKVYFIVGARINGADYYLPAERSVEVTQAAGGLLPGAGAGAVAAALAVAAVACAALRRRDA